MCSDEAIPIEDLALVFSVIVLDNSTMIYGKSDIFSRITILIYYTSGFK
jgi:hypothetical protein